MLGRGLRHRFKNYFEANALLGHSAELVSADAATSSPCYAEVRPRGTSAEPGLSPDDHPRSTKASREFTSRWPPSTGAPTGEGRSTFARHWRTLLPPRAPDRAEGTGPSGGWTAVSGTMWERLAESITRSSDGAGLDRLPDPGDDLVQHLLQRGSGLEPQHLLGLLGSRDPALHVVLEGGVADVP